MRAGFFRGPRVAGLLMLSGLAAMPGCDLDAPDTSLGQVYRCDGYFHCLGRQWELVAQDGCAQDADEASELYIASAQWISEHTDCAGTEHFAVLCKDTGNVCTK